MEKLVILIIIIGYFIFNKITGIGIPCFFHELTNLYCPGCGITRMIFSILQLDFYQAFRYNPFVFILLSLFIIKTVFEVFKGKINISNKVYYCLIVIAILFGVLRNIPIFDYLKPTVVG